MNRFQYFLVKISSGELSGWGEAGQYGPPEPVASAIKARDQKQNYCLNEIKSHLTFFGLYGPLNFGGMLCILHFCSFSANTP